MYHVLICIFALITVALGIDAHQYAISALSVVIGLGFIGVIEKLEK
jgi:hypothetical protein